METDAKIIAMPGVARQSDKGLTVDETIANCLGRYDRVAVIGRLPDGSYELNSPSTREEALYDVERAKKIIMNQ